MDINQILIQALGPILTNYWWLWLLLAILSFLKTPFMKGVIGEALVNLAANLFLDKQFYKLFKNVTLPTEDGGTTQIDHVIVSRYGVFVIETKNMKGWIFGSANQKTWTQKIYRHTNQFQNPLHQNYKHTQTLQSALNLEPDKLFSLVVFIGDSEFKTPMPENVVYAGGYIRFIKSKRQAILADSEVANICRALESGRLKPSIKTHVDHVRHVKTIVEQKQKLAENACPKCGRPMVLRIAKSGEKQGNQFWGCSGFPRCRAVRPA
ncbi:nuclease [Methylomonas methanica]|uniref:Nuclease n=1 Tax=Methylomonas methanica TaxID=421 RepID=A0A177MFK1_METMH|nr:NERD domain-containing protein [Methylomonas methanica]OAI03579.1 nuclease [Methylomonas methanica]